MKATLIMLASGLALTAATAACTAKAIPQTYQTKKDQAALAKAAILPAKAAPAQAAPKAEPPPPPSASPARVYDNYLDAPASPGNWRYLAQNGITSAQYGPSGQRGVFEMICAAGQISLVRGLQSPSPEIAANGRIMRITTETTDRQFATANERDGIAAIARFAPRDSLLDAMAITRGRFVVELEGEETLYLPAWPVVSRVIEDCR